MLPYYENIQYKMHFTHIVYDIMDAAKDSVQNLLVCRYFFPFIQNSEKCLWQCLGTETNVKRDILCSSFSFGDWLPSLLLLVSLHTPEKATLTMSSVSSFKLSASDKLHFYFVFSRREELPLAWTMSFLTFKSFYMDKNLNNIKNRKKNNKKHNRSLLHIFSLSNQ